MLEWSFSWALQALALMTNNAFLPSYLALTPSYGHTWSLILYHLSLSVQIILLPWAILIRTPYHAISNVTRDFWSPGNGKLNKNERSSLPLLLIQDSLFYNHGPLESWCPNCWRHVDAMMIALVDFYQNPSCRFCKIYKCLGILSPSSKYFIILSLFQASITIAIQGLISSMATWNINVEIVVQENVL